MLIDLTCPAEVFRAALPTAEIPAVTLTLYNLSDRIIVSAEAAVRLTDKGGAELEKVVYRARALNGRPHSTFPMVVPCSFRAECARAEVVLEKIWFNDNAVWRRDPANAREYTPNQLPVSKGLTNLKYVAGETAVGYPSQQDGLWVCVCGRPNPDEAPLCDRCRRQKDLIFARFNREAVEKVLAQKEQLLELKSRSVLEDTARLQRIREEEYNRKKHFAKVRRRTLALAAAIVVFVCGIWFAGLPALRLWSAQTALERGETEAARTTLLQLGSFPGAQGLLAEADARLAERDARESNDPLTLKAAAEALRALPDREGALELALKADVRRARALLGAKDYAGALAAASELPEGNPDRLAVEQACDYAQATSDMERGEYTLAREGFLALGDYRDAADLASRCLYTPAVASIGRGELDAALLLLCQIPEYKDSRTLISKCHYLKAAKLEEEDPLGAAAEYQAAGDYLDAPERLQACTYAAAEAAFAAGDFETAEKLYVSLGDYEDAAAKAEACGYTLAKRAFAAGDYAGALARLDALPDTVEDTAELRIRAAYLAGMAALEKEDWAEAVRLLERAGDYRDAPDQLTLARYEQAGSLLEAGDGAGARAILETLGTYKQTKARLREADYLIALKLAEKGTETDEAIAAFEALGDYKDAKEQLKKLYFTKAGALEDLKQTLPAARMYAAAGDWPGAAEKAEALFDEYYGTRAEQIRAAMDTGEWALALTLLDSLNLEDLPAKYADLKDLKREATLQTGESLFAAGKVYAALPYFRAAGDDTRAQARLESPCYLILGTWTGRGGETFLFRENGTCSAGGAEYAFRLKDDWGLWLAPVTADQPEPPEESYREAYQVTSLTRTRMSLRSETGSVYLERSEESPEP